MPQSLRRGTEQLSGFLIPCGDSASSINYRNCVFSPTYFGPHSPETTRPSRESLSHCRVTLHANSCFPHLFLLPHCFPGPDLDSEKSCHPSPPLAVLLGCLSLLNAELPAVWDLVEGYLPLWDALPVNSSLKPLWERPLPENP